MTLCMSHYIYKSIPDAEFEAGSSYSLGDMTSQDFPRKKGTSHQIRHSASHQIYPRKMGLTFKNKFYVQNRSYRAIIDPPCQFQQFSSRGSFFIFKIFGTCPGQNVS